MSCCPSPCKLDSIHTSPNQQMTRNISIPFFWSPAIKTGKWPMLGSACCSKNKLQQKWVNSLWQRNSQTGLQELNKWLFFSFYYQQTLVARLILREANYALKPYRLYSAPGILVPLYSIVTFCISERRSWDDNFRDTRPGCWVVWCHLWPFWNFAREKEKKKKKARPSRG